MLTNLLSNVIKCSESGRVTVEIAIRQGGVEFHVCDTSMPKPRRVGRGLYIVEGGGEGERGSTLFSIWLPHGANIPDHKGDSSYKLHIEQAEQIQEFTPVERHF